MEATAERLWRVIAEGRDGVLATVNADGSPQLSNIYYLADPSKRLIRFSTTTLRVKGRNLLRRPTAAVHVSGRNFLNFAVAEGPVSVAVAREADDDAVAELLEVHSALGASTDPGSFGRQMVADHRMVVRLAAERVYGQLIDREPRPR